MVKKVPLFSHLILRDYLAVDRTRLANERTLLSYLRTGLTLVIAGVSGYNVFQDKYMRILGLAAVFCGIGVMGIGLLRYKKVDDALSNISEPDYTSVDHPIIQGNAPKLKTLQVAKKLVK